MSSAAARNFLWVLVGLLLFPLLSEAQDIPEGAVFGASTRGSVFYWVGCSNFKKLKVSNRIFFGARAEADRLEAMAAHITPATFRFLKELAQNNERDWFNENKQRYIDEVRDPLLAFIAAFEPKLDKISSQFVADARPNGGSLFRIYRDTRFSKNKSPYKTYAGMTFRHHAGRELAAPGFYLHIEPGRVFSATGMWHSPTDALQQIRKSIIEHPDRWKRATRGRGRTLDQGGDTLKRPPRGFDPEHPLIEDLKRKSYTMSENFTQKQTCAPDFLNRFAQACKKTAPLMEFLSEAVGVEW